MLEGDGEIQRWKGRLGAESTMDVWPRRLAAFCVDVGKTPSELVALAVRTNERGQRIELRNLFESYEKRERAKGRKGSTVAFVAKVLRSWLSHNGIDIPRGLIKIRDSDAVYSEAALTREELRRVLASARPREKAAIALMAFTGFRPMVLGNYGGSDGLRIADLPDLAIDRKRRTIAFGKVPAQVVVRRELSKARHVYSSFVGSEGTEYVADYLSDRMRDGEQLEPGSPLIVPERATRDFIRTTNIGDLVRTALRRTGLRSRPYSLRTTFATRMLSAEADGAVPHAFVQYWMGHSGDMTARYAQNRGLLPPEIVERMRGAYSKCERYLSTVEQRAESTEELLRVILADLMRSKGANDKQISDAVSGRIDPKAVGDLVRRLSEGQHRRVLASGEDAKSKLISGWNPIATLPDGSVVLEGPADALPQAFPSNGPPRPTA